MNNKKPLLIYQKNADKTMNRIILPKKFIETYGRNYYMYVYDDYIKIVPMKIKKGE